MDIILEPSLFSQYFKGLFIGALFGWFIASLIYYTQYNKLIQYLQGEDEE